MGKEYGIHEAKQLAEALHERMLGVWYSMEAKGDLPENAEEFANIVIHTLFDVLAAGVTKINYDTGLHPDDPRAQEQDG